MSKFIRLHDGAEKPVYINSDHIVKIEEQAYPPRTLISTVDDTLTAVTEYIYEVMELIQGEERN